MEFGFYLHTKKLSKIGLGIEEKKGDKDNLELVLHSQESNIVFHILEEYSKYY